MPTLIKSLRFIVLDRDNKEIKGAVVIMPSDLVEMHDGGDLPKSLLDLIPHGPHNVGQTGQRIQLKRFVEPPKPVVKERVSLPVEFAEPKLKPQPVLPVEFAEPKLKPQPVEPDPQLVTTPTEKDLLRSFLTSAGVEYHPRLGVKKLRVLVEKYKAESTL